MKIKEKLLELFKREQKPEYQRSAQEIFERELETTRSLIYGATGYYAPGSDQERSILGAYEGLTTKDWIEPFAKKHPEVKRINIVWKYWSTKEELKSSSLDLFLDEDQFRIVGGWPEENKLITEVWDRKTQQMIRGGRSGDTDLL